MRFARGVALQAQERRDAAGDLLDPVRLRPVGEGAESQAPDRLSLSPLKDSAPARMRPSSSGSTTCMARSAGARPRWFFSQASRRVVATMTWNTGTPARSNRVSTPGSAPEAKAVAVTMAAGFRSCKGGLDEGERCRILEAGDEDRDRGHAAFGAAPSQSASIGATSAASSIER